MRLFLFFLILILQIFARDYRQSTIEFLDLNRNNQNFDSVIRFRNADGEIEEKIENKEQIEEEIKQQVESNERTIRSKLTRDERKQRYRDRRNRSSYSSSAGGSFWDWYYYFFELGMKFSWESYMLIDLQSPSDFFISRLIEFNNTFAFIPYFRIHLPAFYSSGILNFDSFLEANYATYSEQTAMFSNGNFPLNASVNIGTNLEVINYLYKINGGFKIDFQDLEKSYLKMKVFAGVGLTQITGNMRTFRYPSLEEAETDLTGFSSLNGVVVEVGNNILVNTSEFSYTYGFGIDFVYDRLLLSFSSEIVTTQKENIYFTSKMFAIEGAFKF